MKASTDTLTRFAPPLWLTLMLAAVVCAALLAAFVDALQQNVRYGEQLRHGQRAGTVQQVAATVTHPCSQLQRAGTSVSSNLR